MAYEQMVAALADPSMRPLMARRLYAALPGSADALLDGLRDGPPSVRRWCAKVLDHAPQDERVERALLAATHDRNRKVRKAALHSLACTACKPDGCLTTDGVGHLVAAMVNDRSLAVRRAGAGVLMFGQLGRDDRVTSAFEQLLADDDPILRDRAAMFFAFRDVPRADLEYGEWIAALTARTARHADVATA